MVRRWVIRGLALTLLTLCVTAWVGSYRRNLSVAFIYSRGQGFDIETTAGRVHFGWMSGYLTYGPELRFRNFPPDDWYRDFTNKHWYEAAHGHIDAHFGGFGFQADPSNTYALIPLWFPTLLSALLLWLVWRKTRPTYNGRGFPVEVAGKEATKP